jgi:hypothetical protein
MLETRQHHKTFQPSERPAESVVTWAEHNKMATASNEVTSVCQAGPPAAHIGLTGKFSYLPVDGDSMLCRSCYDEQLRGSNRCPSVTLRLSRAYLVSDEKYIVMQQYTTWVPK